MKKSLFPFLVLLLLLSLTVPALAEETEGDSDKENIGHFMIEDAKIIIDEAGIEYNNQNYKTSSPFPGG